MVSNFSLKRGLLTYMELTNIIIIISKGPVVDYVMRHWLFSRVKSSATHYPYSYSSLSTLNIHIYIYI